MANRLAGAASPYLEQHADNPVDWWPWSPEAFEEARRRDVPVLISVGYAACHWCHVMAHESFEDAEVAKVVNASTVPIKVDREERPDVDAVYMAATQAMTGQGGWPMTVFATPDGEPFYCGTYFPRDNFVRLVSSVDQAWREQREAVLGQGAAVVRAIAEVSASGLPEAALTPEVLDQAAASLQAGYDRQHGGLDLVPGRPSGTGPKFPPHMALLFLLRQYQRTADKASLEAAQGTCEAMARGGLYDQVGGGFARYSVDQTWTVPHFEKMLYDNALLLRVYTQLWRLTGDPLARRVADETAAYLVGTVGSAGGFVSSEDADTDGVEGATYVFTPAQLREALGDADGDWAADLLGVTDDGNFEHGTSVLRLRRDVDGVPEVAARWSALRTRLREVRDTRPQPGIDAKIVASWNGLAITAMIEYAQLTAASGAGGSVDPAGPAGRAASAALAAAELLATVHLVDGRLRRISRDGVVGPHAAVLEDYGCVAEAFCAVHQYTADGRWLSLAGDLLDTALEHFADGSGGFYDTADDAERLVHRPADVTDNATPAGLSSVAAGLTAYSALSGQPRYRAAAEQGLARVSAVVASHARFAGYAAAVGEALVSGPYEVAVATADRHNDPLVHRAWRTAPPGAVIVAGEPDRHGVPLLADRPMRGGASTAYVCRGFVCDAPVTSPDELAGKLAG